MSRNVLMLGDVHSAFGYVTRAIDHHRKTLEAEGKSLDQVIQVGDFGHYFAGARMNSKGFGVPFYFIDGNHDNIPWLKSLKAPYEVADNTFYVPRATHLNGINFLGGAQSIDKLVRKAGYDWFEEEIPDDDELEAFEVLPPAQVWVTHTGPADFVREAIHLKDCLDPVSLALEKIYKRCPHKPEYWFSGHLHTRFGRLYQEETTKIVLDCVHSRLDQNYEQIPPDRGFLLTMD